MRLGGTKEEKQEKQQREKEEKQAKRQKKMDTAVERRLQQEQKSREKRGALKEGDPQYIASLQKYEYRVLKESAFAGWGGGEGDPIGLEGVLNGLARDGWRVVSAVSTGQVKAHMTADMSHTFILLERPLPPSQTSGNTPDETF